MRKKLSTFLTAVAVLIGVFVLSGCATLDFWKHDILGHYHKGRSQLNNMHQFIDRHFFDYNWDDPYLPR